MHLNEIRATAFGPFRNASLQLAPGLNVVHGPNEAGKSSWFAATYAGLSGRRKARGRGTLAQADFRNRHKPWSGSQWSAGVTLTLDQGLVLALEHDLNKGESRIVDSESGRAVPVPEMAKRLGMELTTESTLDGTRLLGLNRDSARATIFTGQADVLRVLQDAAELQEFLERAATSEVADVTAEGALAWLSDLRSEHVGSEHLGRKPFRARTERLLQARGLSSARRDQLIRLMDVITERQGVATQLAKAKADVDLVDRIDRWTDIRALQQRLDQAEALSAQLELSAGADVEIDEDRIRAATLILGAYDSGSSVQPLPEGATAAELEAQLSALPAPPQGDLEPKKEILQAREGLTRTTTALQTHIDGAPDSGPAVRSVSLSADELRTFADVLEAQPPVVETPLADELALLQEVEETAGAAYLEAQGAYEAAIQRNEERRRTHAQALEEHARLAADLDQARAAYLARQSEATQADDKKAAAAKKGGTLIAAGGALLLLVGVALAVMGATVPGIVLALAGGAGLAAGLMAARRPTPASSATMTDTAPQNLAPPSTPDLPQFEEIRAPVPPTTNPRVMELRVVLMAQENAVQQYQERLSAIRARLIDQSFQAEPAALRQFARAIDDSEAAQSRRQRHTQVEQTLRRERDQAARALAAALGEPVGQVITDDDLARLTLAVDTYVEDCRQRTVTAQSAGRRDDLTAALEQRRQLEDDRAAAAKERERQVTAVLEFARALGGSEEVVDTGSAATRLRVWLADQQKGRTTHAAHSELSARLDQLLEGRAVEEWQRELAGLVEAAGSEPRDMPADIESFRAQVTTRHEFVVARAGALLGRQEQLSRGLGSVAEAIEEEAAAERALHDVTSLRTCIDAAAAQLNLARDRAHANIAPALEARVRPLLPRITEGRYLDVVVDPSDLGVRVAEASGAVREARLLSQGTMEQIFLLLRIALAQVLAGSHETAPLILDDVTVQSDQERTVAIMTMLHELSAECQVVLFTQEQEVIDWASQNLTRDRDRIVALKELKGATK